MKKISTYLLQFAACMMLCSAMASCSSDDLADDDEGTLPPGSHPLSFVATVGNRTARSEGKNFWKDGDCIGVRTINLKGRKYSMLGCYSLNEEGMIKDIVKRYTESADGTWNELDEEPLEWPYPKGKVSAWYPFDPQIDVALDNQAEKGFDHLDFLSVTTDEKSYKEVVDLEFKHRMAKVTCQVRPGDGITPEEFETLWLKFQGHTTCTFKETELTGGNNIGWIIPDSTYNYTEGSTYEALLVPNEMSGRDIISIGLKTNYEGNIIPKNFSYPSPVIEEGKHYKYFITVQKDRIDVSFYSVLWDDENPGQHPATKFTFRVNLTEDLVNVINVYDSSKGMYVINKNLVELSDNVTPIRNENTSLIEKFDVEGNEFTLSIRATKDTRSKVLVVTNNEAVNNSEVTTQTGTGMSDCFVKNKIFIIADETTIGYEDRLSVGDFFFNDGSWSSIPGWPDVHCVGIVFAVNKGNDLSVFNYTGESGEYEADNFENYNFTDSKGSVNPIYKSKRIRGYVLALEDAIRWDTIDVVKEYAKKSSFQAGTLQYDTKVVVARDSSTYQYMDYPAGTLPYDIRVVKSYDNHIRGGTYKKGTVYPAGSVSGTITVVIDPDTTIYAKGTSYTGGTVLTKLTVTSLNVPNKVVQFPWSPLTTGLQYYGKICSLSTEHFNGFANMVSVKDKEGLKLGSHAVPPFKQLEAFAAAEDYQTFRKAPEGTSGWYLPSIMQLKVALGYLFPFNTHLSDSPIVMAGGISPSGDYWSSTISTVSSGSELYPGIKAHFYRYVENRSSISEIPYSAKKCVRAILTF